MGRFCVEIWLKFVSGTHKMVMKYKLVIGFYALKVILVQCYLGMIEIIVSQHQNQGKDQNGLWDPKHFIKQSVYSFQWSFRRLVCGSYCLRWIGFPFLWHATVRSSPDATGRRIERHGGRHDPAGGQQRLQFRRSGQRRPTDAADAAQAARVRGPDDVGRTVLLGLGRRPLQRSGPPKWNVQFRAPFVFFLKLARMVTGSSSSFMNFANSSSSFFFQAGQRRKTR